MRNHRDHYFNTEGRARIEIIPMIDIMMFLLVFFMIVTIHMIQGAGIALELPKSSSAQKFDEPAKIAIGVTRDGKLYIDRKPVSDEELIARLKALLAERKVDVVIAGDKGTRYENIVRVMDLVRAAGIASVALATSAT